MKRKLVAGNWKMYKTPAESIEFLKELAANLKDYNDREVLVCPPFISLYPAREILQNTSIKLGAQNVYSEKEGAYTGEISPEMLKNTGVEYVICGHSERRNVFKETDSDINGKIKLSAMYGLIPILCVGEKLEDREKGSTFNIIRGQLEESLAGFKETEKLVIAYEPVWAIGTGLTATPEQAEEVHLFIRKLIEDLFGKKAGGDIRILYGGSVKPDNIDLLMHQNNIDGVLVGGASLKSDSFLRITDYR
ncbi:MAG TPA: triose-phosphate isomerase [bacterium]|nr:triose-phosphate isomerase [bacterium]